MYCRGPKINVNSNDLSENSFVVVALMKVETLEGTVEWEQKKGRECLGRLERVAQELGEGFVDMLCACYVSRGRVPCMQMLPTLKEDFPA